jgi:hypothetical protein
MKLAFNQSKNKLVNQLDSQLVGVPCLSLSCYAFSTNCIFWSHFSDKAGNVSLCITKTREVDHVTGQA